jgi:hypothetical protein
MGIVPENVNKVTPTPLPHLALRSSVFSFGNKASFVASGSSSLPKYTNVPNSHLL